MAKRWGRDAWAELYGKHADKDFRTAATKYLAEYEGKDVRRAAISAEALLPYIGSLKLIEIDDDALATFKNDRLRGQGAFTRKAMAGTVNKDVVFVTTVLNRACRRWRWIPSAPLLSRVKGPTKEPYPITFDEQDRWFRNLPTGWDVGAMLFAINTGCRKEEVFGLKWRDRIEIPEHNTYVFVLQQTKNGKDRPVILNSIAKRVIQSMREGRKLLRRERMRILQELADGKWRNAPATARRLEQRAVNIQRGLTSGLVFFSRTGRRVTGVGKMLHKAWIAAGLPDHPLVKKGMHTTRHTYGHRLRAAGVSAENRDALLGHSNKSLSQHYAVPDIVRLEECAELVVQRRESTVLRVVRSVP